MLLRHCKSVKLGLQTFQAARRVPVPIGQVALRPRLRVRHEQGLYYSVQAMMGIRILLHGCKGQIGQSLCVMPLCWPGKEGSQNLLNAHVCLHVPPCIAKECTLSPLGMCLLFL